MSWSVNAYGKPSAVAAKVAESLGQYKCVDPEESVKQAAGALIAAALAAQTEPGTAVRVEASGHQTGPSGGSATVQPTIVNTLTIKIEPFTGFLE